MKKTVLVFLICVSMVFVAVGVSSAQEGSVEIKGGSFFPTGDLNDDNWDNGLYGQLAGTYRDGEMGLQLGLGAYTLDNNDSYSTSQGKVKADNTLTVYPITLSFLGYWDNGALHLYGGVGLGYSFAKLDAKLNYKDAGFKFKDSDNDGAFEYHALAGVEYDVTSNLYLGVEGQVIRTNQATFSLKDKGVKNEYKAELGGNVLVGKIGFRF